MLCSKLEGEHIELQTAAFLRQIVPRYGRTTRTLKRTWQVPKTDKCPGTLGRQVPIAQAPKTDSGNVTRQTATTYVTIPEVSDVAIL